MPATPRSVRFKVESEPPGATVVRATDQQILGSTPWQFAQPAGSGQLILLLKKQGYADRVVSLDQSANAVVKETLQALVVNMPAPPPSVDPTPVAPTGPGKGKWKKGKQPGPAAKAATPETGSTPTQPATAATPTPQPTPPPPPKEDSHGSRIQVVD